MGKIGTEAAKETKFGTKVA